MSVREWPTKPRVLAGIATLRCVSSRVANAIDCQLLDDGASLVRVDEECSPLHVARARLAKEAADSGYTHFWSLDDDVMPDPACLQRLLDADKEIVGGVYTLRKKAPFSDGTVRYVPSFGTLGEHGEVGVAADWPAMGVARVGWTGLGCTLIRTDVAKLITPRAFRPGDSEDDSIQFGSWAKERGIPVHVCYDAEAGHVHKVELRPRAQYFGHVGWDRAKLERDGVTEVVTETSGVPDGYELVMRRKA